VRTGLDRKRKQFDQVGVGGRRVPVCEQERFLFLQMQLCDVLKGAGYRQARVGKIEASTEPTSCHAGTGRMVVAEVPDFPGAAR
jgi:hypothetical protein